MDKLTLYEIIHITKFLNVRNTFNFIKSLKLNLPYSTQKLMLLNNTKLGPFAGGKVDRLPEANGVVIETIYNSYFEKGKLQSFNELKNLIEFFYHEIDIEDLICFMANVYPENPYLKDTILFDLLKLYNFKVIDWSLIRTHFKCQKLDFLELANFKNSNCFKNERSF